MCGLLITNFKARSQDLGVDAFGSAQLRLCQSWQLDSATGDVKQFSMDGYGRAGMVLIKIRGDTRRTFIMFNPSLTASGSIMNCSLMGFSLEAAGLSVSFGSMAATVTIPVEICALIASR